MKDTTAEKLRNTLPLPKNDIPCARILVPGLDTGVFEMTPAQYGRVVDALTTDTLYIVNLELPDPWRNASVELLPSEIPRKGELIGWTTEPVRENAWSEPRPKFLRLRVADAMWCLNPTTNTDREVYLTLELEES